MTAQGLDSVRETLRRMVAIVRKYKSDLTTLDAASAILRAASISDIRAQKPAAIRALQHFVRDGIAYVYDPRGLEMIQTPPRTLNRGMGDCDDKAILVATFMEQVGLPTRFMAVGGSGGGWGDPDPADGDIPPYSHVLAQVKCGNTWLWLETIVPNAEPGWKPPGITVLMPAHV